MNTVKNMIMWKNASSKSCLELNSLQKSQWSHMSISLPLPRSPSRARVLERLLCSNYYNGLK